VAQTKPKTYYTTTLLIATGNDPSIALTEEDIPLFLLIFRLLFARKPKSPV
jgi:hypothetical protein